MDDSWSPVRTSAGMYWSVEECGWVPCPVPVLMPVPVQRTEEAAPEPAET